MNFTKEEIGAILKKLRQDAGMTQTEVADKIGRRQQIVGHWETGYAQPDANTLFQLCDLYDANIDVAFGSHAKKTPTVIDDGLAEDERQLIENYRLLNAEGQERILSSSDDLVQSGKYKKHDTPCMDREA